MSTTITGTTVPAGPRPKAGTGSTQRGVPRRSVPHLVLGLLLVSLCTAGAVFWSLNVGDRRPALALTRPVALGQTIQAADLGEVDIAVDGAVDAIPAGDAPSITGRTVAASLPAGVLLTRDLLGTARVPGTGRAVAALALEPGQVPPDTGPGSHVLVVLAADPETTSGAVLDADWPGVVVGVIRDANDNSLVVSVELNDADARHVASAPAGRLSVVLVPGGDR